MNRNEIVVRALLEGLAGRVEIKPLGPFLQHTYNDAAIGGLRIRFWARLYIRRVAQVEFPDGVVIDYEATETVLEPWIPPRDEFPEWWRAMGEKALTEDELWAEVSGLLRRANEAILAGRDDEARAFRAAYYDQFDRQNLYNPWFYLTEEQQDEIERKLGNSMYDES